MTAPARRTVSTSPSDSTERTRVAAACAWSRFVTEPVSLLLYTRHVSARSVDSGLP